MALKRWKAWVAIPAAGGGLIRAGEVFYAEEDDPRCKNGRAKLLGDAEADRGPSPDVQAILDNAAAAVAASAEVVGAVEPELEPAAEADEPEPEAKPARKRRGADDD